MRIKAHQFDTAAAENMSTIIIAILERTYTDTDKQTNLDATHHMILTEPRTPDVVQSRAAAASLPLVLDIWSLDGKACPSELTENGAGHGITVITRRPLVRMSSHI